MMIEKPGEYRMRNGRKAIVCSVNGQGEQPVLGCMSEVAEDGKDVAIRWFSNGSYLFSMQAHHYDIVDVWEPETKEIEASQAESTVVVVPKSYVPPLWWHMLVAGASGGILARMVLDALKGLTGWELP